MTETPVKKLVPRMAVPTIVSMLVSSFYNMVDTFFVGRIDTGATAAVGVSFSVMAVIQAAGFFFGHGSANPISRALGRRDRDEAEKMAATGFFSALIAGVVLMVAAFCCLDSLVRLLGAIPEIFADTRSYVGIVLVGTPYMMAALVLNNQLRLQGNAALAMVGIASGAVLNIALDPLFLFAFHMGVSGAALATVLSQLVSFVILLAMTRRRDGIRIRFRNFRPSLRRYGQIVGCGLPALARQGLSAVAAVCLNNMAGAYGAETIAAFSVVNRVTNFAFAAILGFGQGFQPVCGFNYGAGRFDRVREAFWFCVWVSTAALILLTVCGELWAPQIVRLFRDDDALVSIGTRVLRLQCLSLPLMGFITMSNMYLQNIQKTVRASVLSAARQGLFFLPLVYLLPWAFGQIGLELAQPAADALSFVLAVPFALSALKGMRKLERNQAGPVLPGDEPPAVPPTPPGEPPAVPPTPPGEPPADAP